MSIPAAAIELGDHEWLVHVEAWVIQDRNYPDIKVGDALTFALEFQPIELRPVGEATKEYSRRGPCYWVRGALKRHWWRVWVLDFGLRAYTEGIPRGQPREGGVEGLIRLAIDHYAYQETYHFLPGLRGMSHPWAVTGLWRSLSPRQWPPTVDTKYEPIDATDAWDDDDGGASYLLRCRRQ